MILPWIYLVVTLFAWVVMNRLTSQKPDLVPMPHFRDIFPILCGAVFFLLLIGLSGRPIISTLISAGLACMLWVLNKIKRDLFHEPLNFMDFFLVPQIFQHPRFYLPYLLPPRVMLPLILCFLVFGGLCVLESPVPGGQRAVLGLFLLVLLLFVGFQFLLYTNFRLKKARQYLQRHPLSLDLEQDVQRYGLLGAIWLQSLGHIHTQLMPAGIPGDVEHPPQFVVWPSSSLVPLPSQKAPHIVLIQAESFFDLRELHPEIDPDMLPNFDALAAKSLSGHMQVAAHGAYTMRTEFSVLTGMPLENLGLDAFNPYLRAAKRPVWSLARHLRSQGYEGVFISPFDLTFFKRHQVMPNLGFSTLYGEKDFSGYERYGPYISDRSLGRFILDCLQHSEHPLFIFAVSIEAHGPWDHKRLRALPPAPRPALPAWAGNDLEIYIRHMKNTDQMLGDVAQGLAQADRSALLGLYGDHPGSIPQVYSRTGCTGNHTPYVVSPAGRSGPGRKKDLLAQDLGGEILDQARLLAH